MYNFSFVITDKLAGMAMPDPQRFQDELDFLKQHRIYAIVSLTGNSLPQKTLKQNNIEYLHLPIVDFNPPDLVQIIDFVDFVNKMNEQNRGVAVHCHAGVGRTGTMLASYLVYSGYTAKEAINKIRELRPYSIETESQENSIYEYANYLKKMND